MKKQYQIMWIVFIAIVIFIGILNYFSVSQIDDSYISLKYSYNIANGNGITYNTNDGPVEGYSNFLWVILNIPSVILFDDPLIMSKIFGIILLIISIFLIYKIINLFEIKYKFLIFIGIFLFLSYPGTYYWYLAGLETPLYIFFILFASYLMIKEIKTNRFLYSSLAFLGLILTRIDAVVPIFIILSIVLLAIILNKIQYNKKYLIMNLLILISLTLVYNLFRYLYFNDIFPTTYYAKIINTASKISTGFDYIGNLFLLHPLLIAIPIVLIFINKIQKNYKFILLAFCILILTQLMYIIYIGGDWMPLYRFITPFTPLVIITIIPFIDKLIISKEDFEIRKKSKVNKINDKKVKSIKYLVSFITLGLILFIHIMYQFGEHPIRIFYHSELTKQGTYFGKYVKDNFNNDIITAHGAAGAFAYFSTKNNIDISGINDYHISHTAISSLLNSDDIAVGHEKGDGEYILYKNPDIIVFGSGTEKNATKKISDLQIFMSPHFHAYYENRNIIEKREKTKYSIQNVDPNYIDSFCSAHLFKLIESNNPFYTWDLIAEENLNHYFYQRIDLDKIQTDPIRKTLMEIDNAYVSKDYQKAIDLINTKRYYLNNKAFLIHPLLAKYYILLDKNEEALNHVKEAVRLTGDNIKYWLKIESAFEKLYKNHEFTKLVK